MSTEENKTKKKQTEKGKEEQREDSNAGSNRIDRDRYEAFEFFNEFGTQFHLGKPEKENQRLNNYIYDLTKKRKDEIACYFGLNKPGKWGGKLIIELAKRIREDRKYVRILDYISEVTKDKIKTLLKLSSRGQEEKIEDHFRRVRGDARALTFNNEKVARAVYFDLIQGRHRGVEAYIAAEEIFDELNKLLKHLPSFREYFMEGPETGEKIKECFDKCTKGVVKAVVGYFSPEAIKKLEGQIRGLRNFRLYVGKRDDRNHEEILAAVKAGYKRRLGLSSDDINVTDGYDIVRDLIADGKLDLIYVPELEKEQQSDQGIELHAKVFLFVKPAYTEKELRETGDKYAIFGSSNLTFSGQQNTNNVELNQYTESWARCEKLWFWFEELDRRISDFWTPLTEEINNTLIHAAGEVDKKFCDWKYQQKAITHNWVLGRDLFAIMPTGYGKSLCFQAVARADSKSDRGFTLCVTPLVALGLDQVSKNRYAASMLGDKPKRNKNGKIIDCTVEEIILGITSKEKEINILYVAPEKLTTPGLKRLLGKLNNKQLGRIVIDEAHCVSMWGPEFRPDYLHIKDFITEFSLEDAPVLMLTATVSPVELSEISRVILGREISPLYLDTENTADFWRKKLANLTIKEYSEDGKVDRLKKLLETVRGYLNQDLKKGVIFCPWAMSRKFASAEGIAEYLKSDFQREQVDVRVFHGQLDREAKVDNLNWFSVGSPNKARIICATAAFGLGVDIPDIDFIIHAEMPAGTLEYLQQIGRGRDANCKFTLLWRPEKDLREVKALFRAGTGTEKFENNLKDIFLKPDVSEEIPTDDALEQPNGKNLIIKTERTRDEGFKVIIDHGGLRTGHAYVKQLEFLCYMGHCQRGEFEGNKIAYILKDLSKKEIAEIVQKYEKFVKSYTDKLAELEKFAESKSNDINTERAISLILSTVLHI